MAAAAVTEPSCPKCKIALLRNEALQLWFCILCRFVVTDLRLQLGIIRP